MGAGDAPMSSRSAGPRRAVLRAALGAGAFLCTPRRAGAQAGDLRTQRPQAGDRFVFAGGERIGQVITPGDLLAGKPPVDRKSTRLNSSHGYISYAVFCLQK